MGCIGICAAGLGDQNAVGLVSRAIGKCGDLAPIVSIRVGVQAGWAFIDQRKAVPLRSGCVVTIGTLKGDRKRVTSGDIGGRGKLNTRDDGGTCLGRDGEARVDSRWACAVDSVIKIFGAGIAVS